MTCPASHRRVAGGTGTHGGQVVRITASVTINMSSHQCGEFHETLHPACTGDWPGFLLSGRPLYWIDMQLIWVAYFPSQQCNPHQLRPDFTNTSICPLVGFRQLTVEKQGRPVGYFYRQRRSITFNLITQRPTEPSRRRQITYVQDDSHPTPAVHFAVMQNGDLSTSFPTFITGIGTGTLPDWVAWLPDHFSGKMSQWKNPFVRIYWMVVVHCHIDLFLPPVSMRHNNCGGGQHSRCMCSIATAMTWGTIPNGAHLEMGGGSYTGCNSPVL